MFGGQEDYSNYGGGGGGGFMGESASQAQGASAKKNYGDKGMLPVTIKQLLQASQDGPDDSFKVDGRDTNQVTLVALILSVQETSSSVNYVLDDGSGTIDARVWLDHEESEAHMQLRSEWREGVYVRVVGSMRVHNEKKGLIAFNLRKVTDFNELTYHLLDTCHAHLYNTRGPPPSGAKPGANQSSFFSPGRPAVGPGMGGAATPAGAMGGGAAMQVDPGMKLVDAIMAVLKGRDDGDTGTSVNAMAEECSKMLGRHVPLQEVKNATQDLTMDGVLYSTIDEEHFKPCDA